MKKASADAVHTVVSPPTPISLSGLSPRSSPLSSSANPHGTIPVCAKEHPLPLTAFAPTLSLPASRVRPSILALPTSRVCVTDANSPSAPLSAASLLASTDSHLPKTGSSAWLWTADSPATHGSRGHSG